MGRLFPVLLAAVAGAILSAVPAETKSRDLWIAVIVGNRLSPIAALIDGRWWFDQGPYKPWAAPQRPAPTRWQAHPLRGRSLRIATTSRYEEPDEEFSPLGSRYLRIRTDMPGSSDRAEGAGATGVAIRGDVRVGVFAELPEIEHATVLDWVRPYLADTDMAALRTAHAPYRDLAKDAVAAMPFQVEEVVSSQGWDGARYYVLQGDRYLEGSTPTESCTTHARVAIRRSPAGEQRLLAAWGDFDCGGLQIFETPLAWIERRGQVCLVMRREFEDGVEYDLTTPALLGRHRDPQIGEDGIYRQATCSID